MQYKVPQNIDQEDKILGPLTFQQFVYALIGGGMLLFEYSLLPFGVFLLIGIPTLVLTVCFSLLKIQDQPFTRFFVSLLVFLKQPKNRVWQDQETEKPAPPLGKDFMADLNRDDPSTIKGKKNSAPALDPLVTDPAAAILEPTITNASIPKVATANKKVLTVATDSTSQAIPTADPSIAPPAPPAEPAKPARRLTVKTEKGAA